MELSPQQKERFNVLLQQLELTDDALVAHFENAGIEKLVIDKEKKAWHFFFSLNKLIPADVMRIFSTQLRTKFTNIASVSFSIRVQSQHVTEEMVQAYWPLCLQELDGIA